MRMRPLSTALAGLTVCFAGAAAITAQDRPPCVAIAEQSPAAQEALLQAKLEPPPTVTIAGEVPEPCTMAFREGMTLSDLITQAGGLKRTANLTLEVYRVFRTADGERMVVPEIHSIRVDSAYLVNRNAGRIYAAYIPGFTYMVDRAAAFKLRPYDRVVVLALPRYPNPKGVGSGNPAQPTALEGVGSGEWGVGTSPRQPPFREWGVGSRT